MHQTSAVVLLFTFITILNRTFPSPVTSHGNQTTAVHLKSEQLASVEANLLISDDQPLENLSLVISKFVNDIEVIIDEVNIKKAVFLENLESSRISNILHMFSNPPCQNGVNFEDLKESFRIRLGILEAHVRGAISELQDRVSHILRIAALEKTACELLPNSEHCFQNLTTRVNAKAWAESASQARRKPEDNKAADILYSSRPNITWNRIPTICEGGMFRCLDGTCINFQFACDGERDCLDGSDERSDCSRSCTGIRCRNLKCIAESDICNNIDDCGDNTDEQTCFSKETCSLETDSFACHTRKECLSLNLTCDGRADCSDGSDEDGQCDSLEGCSLCFARGGSCLRLPTGPLCLSECPRGYFVRLEDGVCEQATPNKRTAIAYNDTSFQGAVNKLKTLVSRFSNGFILLRKFVDQELIRSTLDMNKCVSHHKQYHVPFEIEY